LQDPIITLRNGRYVVPVKAEARVRVKGIVHDASGSGQTLFIEPFVVVELGNAWREAQVAEAEEIARILDELSALVAANAAALRETLVELGQRLQWHPDYMRVRYENWVNGLAGDWNISRQLPFGVPIPLWYPIGADGAVGWETPLVPGDEQLPIDPSTHVPPGYTDAQRGQPGGFTGDANVMDTWATSSLSPQIVGGWADEPSLYEKVFPYDLRPQAHDIIRTWLFYTVLRSHYLHGDVPWKHVAISGFVFDPDRKKLSKSAGNSPDDPDALLAKHGTDAVRYWAAGGRPGTDIPLDANQFKIGRRLAIKILNASRFVLGLGDLPEGAVPSAAVDLSLLAALRSTVEAVTQAFDDYEYTRALERTETFFWSFCDDYLELVKGRAYQGDASALATLRLALSAVLRLFAPFLPYATEEVWSWWQEGSIHRSSWPVAAEFAGAGGGDGGDGDDPAILAAASAVLGELRKAKTEAKRSMKTPILRAEVSDAPDGLAAAQAAESDLREAGVITTLTFTHAADFANRVSSGGTRKPLALSARTMPPTRSCITSRLSRMVRRCSGVSGGGSWARKSSTSTSGGSAPKSRSARMMPSRSSVIAACSNDSRAPRCVGERRPTIPKSISESPDGVMRTLPRCRSPWKRPSTSVVSSTPAIARRTRSTAA